MTVIWHDAIKNHQFSFMSVTKLALEIWLKSKLLPQSDILYEKCGCSLNLIRLCSILRPQTLAVVEILFLIWGNLTHFSLSSCSLLTVIKRLSLGRECQKRDLASSLCVCVCVEGFDRMESKTSEGGSNMPVREISCFAKRRKMKRKHDV